MAIASKNPDFSTTIASYSEFTLKLFKAITAQSPDKNVMVAPVSVAMAMAMVANGALDSTRAAILEALEINGLSINAFNQANALLLSTLQQLDPQISLTIKNSLHIGGDVLPAFQQAVQTHYQAELHQDEPPGTLKLKNEIDFKGRWTDPFDPAITADGLFTRADGTQRHCRMMMSKKKSWAYYADDRFEMVRLPYGQKRVSFYIVLPAKQVTVSEIVRDLTPANWRAWVGRLRSVDGKIELPRFEVDAEISLNGLLAGLGMAEAFDPARANFRGISPLSGHIDRVDHRAIIRVHEEGTEARAMTTVSVILGIMTPQPLTFHLKADRPFLYVIQEDSAHVPLFTGILADPMPLEAAFDKGEFDLARLAETLELIASELETGRRFNEALGKVYEAYDHAISLEIGRAIREIQLGKPQHEALESLRDRLKLPDLTLYVDEVIRANADEIALLDITRAHAQRIRALLK